MTDVQQKLIEMRKNIPDCTSSRQRLRSILSDYFPTEKQLINSILNAYDEDVETKLKSSSDPTLTALQMIKVLQNDYGLTSPSAFTAIEAWCYMIGYSEIADALESIKATQVPQTQSNTEIKQLPSKDVCEIGLGIYKAGVDIPAGEISIQILKKPRLDVFYGIGKNPNRINDNQTFKDKTYITITEGQFLKLNSYETDAAFRFCVTKVD